MQLLPNHDLKKHPYTNKYYQITTSKNAHIHTTTLRTRPQKHPYTYNYSQITTSKDTPLKSINIKKWG